MELNLPALIFLVFSSISIIALPIKYAPMPLLIGTCYMTLNQGIEIGPFSFPVIRILVLISFFRVIVRREKLPGGLNNLDKLIILFSSWAVISSFFHQEILSALVFRLGLVFNTCGFYFLLRIFCPSIQDVIRLCSFTAILLTPLAVEMAYEKLYHYNYFSILGGVPEIPTIRQGKIRAQGPFAHAI
jgi:hypothetical protein